MPTPLDEKKYQLVTDECKADYPDYLIQSLQVAHFYFHYPTRDLQGGLRLMEQGVTIFTIFT